MAGVSEKLYPPTINGSLPAFYQENGTARIAVPFIMNRAVNSDEVAGFKLKIKTVQSNTQICVLNNIDTPQNAIANRIAYFDWSGFNTTTNVNDGDAKKIKVGQYLKVQMAYVRKSDNAIGYFSTVGIIKYTTKPTVYIEGLGDNPNRIGAFRSNYVGVYMPSEDKSERPYSYCFSLYDYEGALVETSDWQLHNTTFNNVYSESLSLEKTTDEYTFKTAVNVNMEYYVQYSVRTINDLEVASDMYTCIETDIGQSEFLVNLNAENVFEEGYVKVYLTLKDGYTNLTPEQLKRKYHTQYVDGTVDGYLYVYRDENHSQLIAGPLRYISLHDNPVSLEICRAEKTDDYSSWRTMTRIYFSTYDYALDSWDFKDFTVEQGVTYKYCFRQYNKQGVQSSRSVSNEVFSDFEDMFLWDGKKQLKIRFNPKVTSFKTNHLESKLDTIGSRFPFIFRNGIVEYKEFPIAGLISYLTDNNELFINHSEDLNIILGKYSSRQQSPIREEHYTPAGYVNANTYLPSKFYLSTANGYQLAKEAYYTDYPANTIFYEKHIVYTDTSYETAETLDSVGYNMRAERRFKLKLLEWLGNGKVKMFKSPAEGNYFVRLLNISLTPEDKLGRMLHSFTSTAYEVEEFSYVNLVKLGFLDTADSTKSQTDMKTIKFANAVAAASDITQSIKINEFQIFEYARIETSPNGVGGAGFYVRIGQNTVDNKVYVQPGFTLEVNETDLPDIYFCATDNLELLQTLFHDSSLTNETITAEQVYSLVADAQLTYRFKNSAIAIGELYNIKDVYLVNTIKTIIGPTPAEGIYFGSVSTNTEQRETLKFLALNFKERPLIELTEIGDNSYVDRRDGLQISHFEELPIYIVYQINGTEKGAYVATSNGTQLSSIGFKNTIHTNVILTTSDGAVMNYDHVPIVNTTQFLYTNIVFGNGVYAECAYQEKVIEYNQGT